MKLIQLDSLDIPLDDTVNVAVTFQISDVRDLSKRASSVSKTIAIKSTPSVDKFFNFIFDIQSSYGNFFFDVSKRTPCKLLDNGTLIIDGYLRMISIVNVQGEITYNVGIFGSVANLFADMGEDYIDEVVDTLLAPIANTQAVYEASWNTDLPYYFTRINKNAFITNATVIGYNNFKLTWNLKFLFDKVLENYGYAYDSTFLTNDFFNEIFIYSQPIARELTDEEKDNREIILELVSNTTHTIISNPADISLRREKGTGTAGVSGVPINYYYYYCSDQGFIPVPSFTAMFTDVKDVYNRVVSSKWRPFEVAKYNIDFQLNINSIEASTFGGVTYTEVSYINIEVYAIYNGVTSLQYTFKVDGPFSNGDSINKQINIVADDRFQYEFKIKYLTIGKETSSNPADAAAILTDTVLIPANVVLSSGSSVTINQEGNNLGALDTYFPNEKLPHIKCKDLVRSFMRMFNLMIDVDKVNPKNLVIEDYPSFYNIGQIDWTSKLARNKEIVITPLSEVSSKTLKYRHKYLADTYNEQYKTANEFQYGEASLVIQNDFASGETITETFFSQVPPADITNQGVPLVNLFDLEGTAVTSTVGLVGTRFLIATPITVNYPTPVSYAYAPLFMDVVGGTVPFSIGFQTPKEVYYTGTLASSYPNNNLFTLFYASQLAEYADPKSRLMTAYFSLNEIDIYNFDFRKQILVDNTLYRCNKIIDYNGSTGLTKVELLKVINATVDLLPPSDINEGVLVANLVDGGQDIVYAAYREFGIDLIDGGKDIVIGPSVINNITSIDGGRS